MKTNLKLILLSILLLTFGCQGKTNGQKTTETEKQVEQKTSIEQQKDTAVGKKKKEVPKHLQRKYVIARSGLNYRDSPNGKVLGKFPLNTQLKVIEYTKNADQVKDGENTIKGEWVGVEKNSDTVYVFNGFLSSSYVQSDIKLYYTTSYRESNGNARTAFLNLSETYFQNTYNEIGDRNKNLILTESDLAKDTIRLNQNQRTKLIDKLKLSESDKVFIYQIKSDSVIKLNIKDLSAIARMNIYVHYDDYQNQEEDYEFGFDLGKTSGNFVYIGEENPFQTGKLKPIVWKEISNQDFPKKFNSNIIDDRRRSWFKGIESGQSYKFSTNNINYYIQNLEKDKKLEHRYIIVIDLKKNEIIYENVFIDSESTFLIPLNIENSKQKYSNQWTGKLFKNKPVVIFGFLDHTFGCPSITVLDDTEPTIPILCDNRH